ncbi:FAD-binding oxidoreductase [Streptomyces scopuliridis]|uniref:FAD-binding oxidoreductase n=1 Tax=Streptomyces scopuliridis TaxID=452529 RepID=A0ACD4ZY53_9ACTN|nr:FAD-dependent oxidoreductase [Streptomyces scopuliridis]WSC02728.1 FAD-binding oxidoreductase [Streptomyces scopuliridis]WSC03739.1 FAD-binding oxidoreductase [Streptomyces scopuliridis]
MSTVTQEAPLTTGPDGAADATGIGAAAAPYWLDRPERPEPLPCHTGDAVCDLAVVGGGYTGLWTALLAKRRHPGLDVFLIEQDTCGGAAGGRNGGFCSPSLTHGLPNGLARRPDEIAAFQRLGADNLASFQRDLEEYGIDCGFTMAGKVSVAATPWQAQGLRAYAALARRQGEPAELLDQDRLRAYVDSPAWTTRLWQPHYVLLDPARLAWGRRAACLAAGVRIAEQTRVTGMDTRADRNRVRLSTPYGTVAARRTAPATNAFPPPLRRLSLATVPVYDYALTTQPLTDAQLASIGWTGEHGITDAGNQFHYLRKTGDNRVLWGGYDAIYHYGGTYDEPLTKRPETFAKPAGQFRRTFPQVTRTSLRMIRRAPVPFPPEPVRWLGIQATRWSMAREDETGRRNLWLRSLDRLGLGFDS